MSHNRLRTYHPSGSRNRLAHRLSSASCASSTPLVAASPPTACPSSRYRSILVPLDGTTFAEHAIPYALDLAERTGASIKLAHVHSVFDGLQDSWPLYFDNLAIDCLKRRKEGYLNRVCQRILHRSSVRVHSSLITGPDVVDALCRSDWLDADIVIMATHARNVIGRLYRGDVVHRLLRTTNLPVLLVPGGDKEVGFAAKPVRKIVLPLDGTPAAERVLKPAVAFGDKTRTKYTLMQTVPLVPKHVIRLGALRTDWVPSNKREKHSLKYLDAHAQLLRVRGCDVSTSVVSSNGPIADTIRSFAVRSKADLIAVTSRKRNAVSRMLWPNTAEALIQGARVPVLVVPSGSHAS